MIASEKVPPALYALHRILVQARWLVGEGAGKEKLYEILDHAEILPVMIGNGLDDGEGFLSMLESLAQKYTEFSGIVRDYEQGVCGSGIQPRMKGATNGHGPDGASATAKQGETSKG